MAQTDSFWTRGKSAIKILPAVAGSSPTRSEISAGVDLSLYVAGISGFTLKNAPTKRCEVWPCRVTGTNDDWAGAMDTKPAQLDVSFAVLSRPNQNATIPA
jgi:hypothetical protein